MVWADFTPFTQVQKRQVEEDIGLSVGAAWIVAQDRSMWRTLRPSAGQAQQCVSE